jgi:hypothetical protein
VADLSVLSKEQCDLEVRRLFAEQWRTPFDLSRGPLFRCMLLRLSPTDHVFVIVMHHIISDGWSFRVMAQELSEHYQQHRKGYTIVSRPVPVQYADFGIWQRELLEANYFLPQLNHWLELLGKSYRLPEIPNSRQSPSQLDFHVLREPIAISIRTTEILKELAQDEGCTLFMALVALIGILLSSSSGQEDVRIATLVANRNQSETEDLIGLFVNTVVLPLAVARDSTFRDLLNQARSITLQAFANQDVPFEIVVKKLVERKVVSHASGICNVMFVMQGTAAPALQLPGISVTALSASEQVTQADVGPTTFDLVFMLYENNGSVAGYLKYKSAALDAVAIAPLVSRFHELADALAAAPGQDLASVAGQCIGGEG